MARAVILSGRHIFLDHQSTIAPRNLIRLCKPPRRLHRLFSPAGWAVRRLRYGPVELLHLLIQRALFAALRERL